MNTKRTMFLTVLVLSVMFTKKVSASNQYEKELTKVNSSIKNIRCLIKKDRKFIKNLSKDIEMFKELESEIQNKSICETYKSLLINQRLRTKKEIKKYKKRLKKCLRKRKKLKKKIKYFNAHSFNEVLLQYSKPYNITANKLTRSNGTVQFNGHRETYYSQRVLAGNGLRIPDRHVADDGTIRDKDGYICVASNPRFYSRGSKLMTSLGPAKVYDCGCAYGTIDVYTNW